MADHDGDATEIAITFTEQQMELIEALARETGQRPADAVAAALAAFIAGEGRQYMR